MKGRSKLVTALLVVAVLVLGYVCAGRFSTPRMVCRGMELPGEQKEAILSVERGYYSEKLPLIPRKIELLEANSDHILYRVYYFPFGNIERSYSKGPDGNWLFNLEKQLYGY